MLPRTFAAAVKMPCVATLPLSKKLLARVEKGPTLADCSAVLSSETPMAIRPMPAFQMN